MENFYGVLVTICICDKSGNIYDDLCTLFAKDRFTSYDDALRCYDSINFTTDQEVLLWLYMRNRIEEGEGLYLSYEIIDSDGNSEPELEHLYFSPVWLKERYGIDA